MVSEVSTIHGHHCHKILNYSGYVIAIDSLQLTLISTSNYKTPCERRQTNGEKVCRIDDRTNCVSVQIG